MEVLPQRVEIKNKSIIRENKMKEKGEKFNKVKFGPVKWKVPHERGSYRYFKKTGAGFPFSPFFEKRKMLKFCKATPLLSHSNH